MQVRHGEFRQGSARRDRSAALNLPQVPRKNIADAAHRLLVPPGREWLYDT